MALTALGDLAGLIITAAGMDGPLPFFTGPFAEELVEDPSPLARAIVGVASGLGKTAVGTEQCSGLSPRRPNVGARSVSLFGW